MGLWNEWLRFSSSVCRYDLAQKHIAAASASRPALEWTHFLRADVLSHHEQLELSLQLRDWLRERAGLSDERSAELLA